MPPYYHYSYYYYVVALAALLVVVGFSASPVSAAKTDNTWKIGGLAPDVLMGMYNSSGVGQIQKLAIMYINNQTDILPNVTLQLEYRSTAGDEANALVAAFELQHQGVRAIAGGYFSSEASAVQLILRYFKTPQCSGSASSYLLSDKKLYPYFFRVYPSDTVQVGAMVAMVQHFNWKYVVFLYTTDDYGIGARDYFYHAIENKNIVVEMIQMPIGKTDFSSQVASVKATNINIIILFAQSVEAQYFLLQANASGMIGPKYVYMLPDGVAGGADSAQSLIDGAIGFLPSPATGTRFEEVESLLNSLNPDEYGTTTRDLIEWYQFDCVYALAVGLDNLIKANSSNFNISNFSGEEYLESIVNSTFLGITGNVEFDANGDRIAAYAVMGYSNKGRNTSMVALYLGSEAEKDFEFYTPIVFYDGTTNPPVDYTPPCGCRNGGKCTVEDGKPKCVCVGSFFGEQCQYESKKFADKFLAITIALPVIVAIAITVFVAVYVQRKKQRQMVKDISDKQRSEIPRGELTLGNRIGRGAAGEVYIATFRGTEVAVKQLITGNATKHMINEFKLESAIMCGLRHPNIVLFMGTCYDKVTKELLLVMEYMGRGSLFDVLHDETIPMSLELRLSLAHQTAQGLNFLHQANPPIIHCDIKSHNILLDDKWSARISDFGITKFTQIAKTKQPKEVVGTFYWMAPEVLYGETHTVKSDCYAFGIVLWEIFHRQVPYQGRDPLSVAMDVMKQGGRPLLDPSIPSDVANLITRCWAQQPGDRPTLGEAMKILRDLTHSSRSSGILPVTIAPTEYITTVIVEVDDYVNLWESQPKKMRDAMKLYTKIMKDTLHGKGYEVGFIGLHTFVAVFDKIQLIPAIDWAIEVLEKIMQLDMMNEGELSEGKRGFQLKMVVHQGGVDTDVDKYTGHTSYSGEVIEKAKLLLEHVAPGCITVSEAANNALRLLTNKEYALLAEEIGSMIDHSEGREEPYFMILPKSLQGRKASILYNSAHSNLDIMDLPNSLNAKNKHTKPKRPKGVIAFSELRIQEQIGLGPASEVFSGIYKKDEVAIKTIVNQNLQKSEQLTVYYLACVLPQIVHPNLVQIYGFCADPPNVSIVSEYMFYGSLQQYYLNRENSLNYSQKVTIALDIARGMSYLSEHADPDIAIHLNLTSTNILIGKNREAKVTDYGTKLLHNANLTLTSVGNVSWVAPEISDRGLITPAAPVYSYGIILYELYSRRLPYVGIHPIKLMDQVANGFRPDIPSDCPLGFKSLIQKCWDGNPVHRPSWNDIINELTKLLPLIYTTTSNRHIALSLS